MIREIRQFQQTPYKIEKIPKVVNYLLDPSKLLDDDALYQRSLLVEPRNSSISGPSMGPTPQATQSGGQPKSTPAPSVADNLK